MKDIGGTRKRLTTYGKAVRKRVPEPVGMERFSSQDGGEGDQGGTNIKRKADSTLVHKILASASNQAQSDPEPSIANMFDVPSTDDEATSTPGKRRKTTHSIRKPIARLGMSDSRGDDVQRLQPAKSSPPDNARSVKTLDSRPDMEGNKAKQMQKSEKTATNSSRVYRDSKKEQQPIPRLIGEAISKSGKTFPPLQAKNGKKQSRKDRTLSSVSSFTPIPQHEELATKSVSNVSRTARHGSPVISMPLSSTPSTPQVDGDARRITNRSLTPTSLTPRGQRMWDGILGDESIELLSSNRASPSPAFPRKSSTNGLAAVSSTMMPRRRLIDCLIEQSMESVPPINQPLDSEAEDECTPKVVSNCGSGKAILGGQAQAVESLSSTFVNDIKKAIPPASISTGAQNSQLSGPKITYSRQRSMLAEQEMTEEMSFDTPLDEIFLGERRQKRRGSIHTLSPIQNFQDYTEIDDGQGSISIRTIHELRQAGAQSRFLDEVEDLLDRIGTPSQQLSIRRSGLMDLTDKMMGKDFNSKFLSNNLDQRLFVHLGQEVDAVSGFMIVSMLILVLDFGITPVAISQLRRHGITRLLIRLLDFSQPITSLIKDRNTNMSKSAQIMVSQQHDQLLKLAIWDERHPDVISPRIAALRCLEMMVRQSREAGNTADLISKELTSKLFDILKLYLGNDSAPTPLPAIDFQLALSVLESHSLRATATLNEHLPVMREVLESVLQYSGDTYNLLQFLALRLTLNVTNNDARTSEIFASSGVMRNIGSAVVSRFSLLSKFMIEDERVALVDQVVLMLGVMMNFAEWSATACQAFIALRGSGSDPLDDMVTIFFDNFEKISEADSVEDSQRNVAFGYLAVVLGYFSLVPELEGRIRARLKTLQPLISSIEEFISHHKKVDEILKDEVDNYSPQTGLTDRFDRMLDGLRGLNE